MIRRLTGFLCVIVILALFLNATACRQSGPTYPEKPVTLVVPFGAGGAGDIAARALAEFIKPYFPQPLAVVNKPGGGAIVGTTELFQSSPDGYTIGCIYSPVVTLQVHLQDTAFKGPVGFRPITIATGQPVVLAVLADSQWKTLKDMLNYAKANPSKIRLATSGLGTMGHIVIEQLKLMDGVNMINVPFASGAEETTAVLGGHVEGGFIAPSVGVGQVKAGKLRFIAVCEEEKRLSFFPDVPTISEVVGKKVTTGSTNWVLLGPKGTPDNAVDTLYDACKKAINSDSYQKFCADACLVPGGMEPKSVQQLLESEYAFYKEFTTKTNMR